MLCREMHCNDLGMLGDDTKILGLEQRVLAGLLLPTWEIAKPIHLLRMDEWASVGFLLAAF